MPQIISAGKVRALRATATDEGIFTILAADHRDSLKVMINPDDLDSVPAVQVTTLKLDVTRAISPLASGVLLDPVYGGPQAIMSGDLPRGQGWICSLEDQGYLGDPHRPQTPMLSGWSIEKAKRLGANGVKILMKYHPDSGAVAEKQRELIQGVLAEGARQELPLFLEPIIYPLDPNMPADSAEFAAQRRDLVVRTAKTFSALGVDVLKLEFPVDVYHESETAIWQDACAELKDVVGVPWALLSAGVSHEVFKKQLHIACQNGCSGFLAGRAVWREAVTLEGAKRRHFLQTEGRQRFQELVEIAISLATPWTKRYEGPAINERWFATY